MDILSWGVRNQEKWFGRLFLNIIYFLFRTLTPPSILINASQCAAVVSDLFRKGSPKCILVLGGLQNPLLEVNSIGPERIYVLGGTEFEQKRLREQFKGQKTIELYPSSSTLEEIAQIMDFVRFRDQNIGLLVHEIHATRATSTLIKQIMLTKDAMIYLTPYPCLDYGREQLIPAMRGLAVLVEAWKLWKYQRKGDVAKLLELMEYVRQVQMSYAA